VFKIQCDLCGTETDLFLAKVENIELNVCGNCAKFGKVIKEIRSEEVEKKILKEEKKQEAMPEIIDSIVSNYPEIIRGKREQLGLKQQEFAKKISEKESIVHHLEIGKLEPSIELAKKLEKLLRIRLVETIEVEKEEIKQEEGEVMTIGDLIKEK
jgi:putative transcription factor